MQAITNEVLIMFYAGSTTYTVQAAVPVLI